MLIELAGSLPNDPAPADGLTPETLELAMLEIRSYVVDQLGAASKAVAAIDVAAIAIRTAFSSPSSD
ncbi:MAG: hypothetical protein OXH75_22070 [Acidobacteria bacterium]|nr:hypothetical protein [Acidobacteriota bacterium]